MSNKLFARSPYIIEVDETGVVGSLLDIRLYYSGTSVPSSPTYELKKPIPSSSNLKMYYDISPYIREYINFNTRQTSIGTISTSGVVANNHNQMVKCQVIRYKETTSGTFVVLDTTVYYCLDGYGYYSEGANPDLGTYSLSQGTYSYHYDASKNPASVENDRAGLLSVLGETSLADIKYTDLVTGATKQIDNPFATYDLYDVPSVWYDFYANGNKLEVWDNLGSGTPTLIGSWIFKPKEECRYTPVMIDFVNKFGSWQREFFLKASKTNINTSNTSYNLMQSSSISYDTLEGQRAVFNTSGEESITVNTDYVSEDYFNVIQEIMLSERILVNSLPAECNTKSLEKQKNINGSKLINYSLEFKYSFNMINSVI